MSAARLTRAVVVALAMLAASAFAHELRSFDAKSIAAIRDAHAGRPFVLAFWSIRCAPCIEDMADFVTLQGKYPNVPIVLVATDTGADRDAAAQFLARYRLGRIETWGFADAFTERVRFAVDKTWRGELPRTYFYDAEHRADVHTGRLDRRWTNDWFARQR